MGYGDEWGADGGVDGGVVDRECRINFYMGDCDEEGIFLLGG